ncbi:hypothetical protein HZF08_02300 [Paenibacillus sp. CGMCC 1.16610]|uniref:Uncharacterized protein n=2 Tax=Paenibacillus anseongense TaxID=2682845 RepID=A0ABW9UCS5_9BACL|nr:CBO0543 family protein [Paenibacillus sp. CGMCC 1.16610]MBA2937128.1 hypothetical protein [Paenibacillus sp. CGMCC 1.16610]MVQ36190.1 hypothetical protein [Paenibacillus anseongense]
MSDQLHEIQQNGAHVELVRWLTSGVFTWQWWFLLAGLIVPWIILLKLIDRKRAHVIWFYGLMILIITSFTDDLGAEIGTWVYPIKLVPYSLISFPFDFSVVPVAQMLIFQYFRSWKKFLIALLIQAMIFAFIGEPFSVWAGTITYYGWTYYYSFLYYIFTGSLTKAFVNYWTPKKSNSLNP